VVIALGHRYGSGASSPNTAKLDKFHLDLIGGAGARLLELIQAAAAATCAVGAFGRARIGRSGVPCPVVSGTARPAVFGAGLGGPVRAPPVR